MKESITRAITCKERQQEFQSFNSHRTEEAQKASCTAQHLQTFSVFSSGHLIERQHCPYTNDQDNSQLDISPKSWEEHILGFHPTPSQKKTHKQMQIRRESSFEQTSPKMERFSGPQTKRSYICKQPLHSEQHHTALPRIPALSTWERTAAWVQTQSSGFMTYCCPTRCATRAVALTCCLSSPGTHPVLHRGPGTQHSCSVCGTAGAHRKRFPQEQSQLCIPT